MNRKQLILILVFLVVIGSAGLILMNRNKESWAVPEAKMGDKVLPDFQPNDVAAIHIRGASDLNLAREKDVWRVQERDNYPADFHQISDVLIKLRQLKVVEADTVEPSDLARVNLEEPGNGRGSGTLVEFKDGQGKVIDSLLVGKKQMKARDETSSSPLLDNGADGCYVRLRGDARDVLLISDPLNSLRPDPQIWLSKEFLKVDKPKSISFASTDAANSWKLTRESESSPWVLADPKPGETLDSSKLYGIGNALSVPRFTDIVTSNAPAQTGLDKPRVVTVETFDHFTYTIKIGSKSADGNYYMRFTVAADLPTGKADEATKKLQEKLKQEQALAPWIYEVGSWILDPVIRDRAQLMQGSEADNTPAPSTERKPRPAPANQGWTPHVIQ